MMMTQKSSPVLVKALLDHKLEAVSCGNDHTVVSTSDRTVLFAWGSNEFGQCGTAVNYRMLNCFQPTRVNFDAYHRPGIV